MKKPTLISSQTSPLAKANVVAFQGSADCDCQDNDDEENDDHIDMELAENRAHTACFAISTLEATPISAREFWSVFGSDNLKPARIKWIKAAISKLRALVETE